MKSILLSKRLALMLAFGLPLVAVQTADASTGITINAAEIGVGKFHRIDNTVHPYSTSNAWAPFVLKGTSTTTPLVQPSTDGSFTVFFSSLDELMTSVEQISKDQNRPVSVLNVHGHGLPGAMWFPKDEKTRKGFGCAQWRSAAAGSDDTNYSQYYSEVSKSEIMQIRAASNASGISMGCTTGLKGWQEVFAKHPAFKAALASDLQVHMLSCVVGLGKVGDAFTKGLASLLLSSESGRVQTSEMFGLGDWSMVEGMGFWDYQTDAQLNHDNQTYPVERTDRSEMQKGTIRIAGLSGSTVRGGEIASQDFMFLNDSNPGVLASLTSKQEEETSPAVLKNLTSIRIPGTAYRAEILK
jgi:hypothetical protein